MHQTVYVIIDLAKTFGNNKSQIIKALQKYKIHKKQHNGICSFLHDNSSFKSPPPMMMKSTWWIQVFDILFIGGLLF